MEELAMTAQQVQGSSPTQELVLGKDFKSSRKFTMLLSAWQEVLLLGLPW